MPVDRRTIIAAHNNADLYQVLFASHGLRYNRRPHAFVAREAPPPYYAHMTILEPDQVANCLEELAALAPSFAGRIFLKDSFCQMQLEAQGFRTLFHASWLWRDPAPALHPKGWVRIETEQALAAWEDAWKAAGSETPHRMFPPDMLAQPGVSFLGRESKGVFDAGCIANASADCIGLSNVFATGSQAVPFKDAAAAVAQHDPAKPIVGYESGAILLSAQSAGFGITGELRVLIADAARF